MRKLSLILVASPAWRDENSLTSSIPLHESPLAVCRRGTWRVLSQFFVTFRRTSLSLCERLLETAISNAGAFHRADAVPSNESTPASPDSICVIYLLNNCTSTVDVNVYVHTLSMPINTCSNYFCSFRMQASPLASAKLLDKSLRSIQSLITMFF